jgi:RsiW-degrading membrane proteinase PrsW (M82 family)
MFRLIIQNGPFAGHQIHLNQDGRRFFLLGRGEECHVRFTEAEVSMRHAIIEARGGSLSIYDEQSTNGTFVNGSRVESSWLFHGDVVELGHEGPRLRIVADEGATARFSNPATANLSPDFGTAPINVAPTTRSIIHDAANNFGLYDPTHDSGASPMPVGVGILLFIIAAFGLAVLGLTGLNLGIRIATLSSIIALMPAMIYLSIFLWLDRFDPEPPKTLAFAFAWGATVSVFFSGIINDLFGAAFGDTLTGIVTAPIIEEAFKGIGVLLVALLFRKDFDSVVDGIVYAGVVALGFATIENIDYYGRGLAQGGIGGLAGVFLIRGVLAPFSHVLFTCMTGIGCGIARETHNHILKVAAPVTGCFGAMFLHALWNTLASFDGGVFFTGYFLLEVPLFILFVFVIAYLVRREGRILKQTLTAEVERGLITPQQLDIAISVFRRTGWVASALGNTDLFNTRRRFLRTVAKLGLCHWHQDRATEARRDTASLSLISQLQAEVYSLRDVVG